MVHLEGDTWVQTPITSVTGNWASDNFCHNNSYVCTIDENSKNKIIYCQYNRSKLNNGASWSAYTFSNSTEYYTHRDLVVNNNTFALLEAQKSSGSSSYYLDFFFMYSTDLQNWTSTSIKNKLTSLGITSNLSNVSSLSMSFLNNKYYIYWTSGTTNPTKVLYEFSKMDLSDIKAVSINSISTDNSGTSLISCITEGMYMDNNYFIVGEDNYIYKGSSLNQMSPYYNCTVNSVSDPKKIDGIDGMWYHTAASCGCDILLLDKYIALPNITSDYGIYYIKVKNDN